ncbi:hypothetical protein CR513_54050, partial [Mucuna pruriens]
MVSHTTWLIAKTDPLKYIFEKPILIRRIARWQMALPEYDIVYTSQKAIKRSALAEQLAHNPLVDYQPLLHEFLDEHIMLFDELSNLLGNKIGVVLASPKDQCFPFSARLGFDYTNNMAKYEACAMGIMMAIKHQVKKLKVFGNLALVIYQLRVEWEACDAKLIPYHNYVIEMSEHFNKITFHYVSQDKNQMADALATLSSVLQVNKGQEMTI